MATAQPPRPPADSPPADVPRNTQAPRAGANPPPAGGAPAPNAPKVPSAPNAPADVLVSEPAADPSPSADGDAFREHEAYAALALLATVIAEKVLAPIQGGGVVLVQDAAGLAALAAYREFRGRTELLAESYDAVAPQAAAADSRPGTAARGAGRGLGAAAAAALLPSAKTALVGALGGTKEVLGGIADVVAMFKPRRQLTSRMFTGSDEALAAEVCGYLARHSTGAGSSNGAVRVYYPPLFPPEVVGPADGLAEIGAALDAVADARRGAAERVAALGEGERPAAQAHLGRLDTIAASLQASLLGGAHAAAPGGDARPAEDAHALAQLVRGATRSRLLGRRGHLLFVKLLRLGGAELTIEHRLGRDTDKYRGMAVASFFLFAADGTVVDAGTERRLSRYVDRDS